MGNSKLSRATLGRVPVYLKFLKGLPADTNTVSSPFIAKNLGLGDVQVRKDLSVICSTGKPRVGYQVHELIACLESYLSDKNGEAVIIGAGKLGTALLDYRGFSDYGLNMLAAFDETVTIPLVSESDKPIYPMRDFPAFCREHDPKIGIIAVPAGSAQSTFNLLYENGIKKIWCFAPCRLYKPGDAVIQYENLALSLAHLKTSV